MYYTFPQTPAHWTLYGLAGGLTADQAKTLITPWLDTVMFYRERLPMVQPAVTAGVVISGPRFPQTPYHWALYAFSATLTELQARYIRSTMLSLVERVERGEDVTKPARKAPKALTAGKARKADAR
jgi:hypothetical protein